MRVTVWFGGVLVVLVLAVWTVTHFDRRYEQALGRVSHTHELLVGLEKLQTALRNTDSNLKDYLFHSQELSLKLVHVSSRRLGDELKHLRALSAADARERSQIQQVETRLAGWHQQVVELLRQKGAFSDSAVWLPLWNDNRRKLDAAWQSLHTAEVGFTELRQQRTRDSLRHERSSRVGMIILAGLIFSLPVAGYFFIRREVAQRERHEQWAGQYEKRLRLAAQCASDFIWEWDPASNRLDWLGAANEALGYPPGQFPGTLAAWRDCIHPDDRERVITAFGRHLERHDPYQEEYRVRRHDGVYCWWRDRGEMLWDANAKPVKMIGACSDITERKLLTETIATARAFADSVIQAAPLPLLVLDLDLRVVTANARFCETYQTTPAETQNRFLGELADGRWNQPELQAALGGLLQDDAAVTDLPIKVLLPTVGLRTVRVQARTVCGAGQPDRLVLLCLEDVTSRRRAFEGIRRTTRRLQLALRSAQLGVWELDLNSGDIKRTLRHDQIFGYATLQGVWNRATFLQQVVPDDRPAVNQALDAARTDGQLALECRIARPDGALRWIAMQGRVYQDSADARACLIGVIGDITEQKQGEDHLQTVQSRLVNTNADLVRRNQEIQNFYHTLSHELKTPLTSAREFIAIVRDGLAGPVTDTQREYLGMAKESCDQLRVCVNDLLDASRVETGKLTLDTKPASMDALIRRVVAILGPAASQKNVDLSCEVPADLADVPMDENRMMQVLSNLLNNALKYTPAGGRIVIQAGDAPEDPGCLLVSVRDTGRGIPADQQTHIFERLYQVHNGDAGTEQGLGLGLYICRELVQLHGGRIWVRSEVDQGSTFSFTLPKQVHAKQATVLIVDDEPVVHAILQRVFEPTEFNLVFACDGQTALQTFQEAKPEVVIVDLVLPGMDGTDLMREIRRQNPATALIVHTGYPEGDLMKRAFDCLPFTLLSKPTQPAQIVETVRAVWRQHQSSVAPENRAAA